MYSHAHPSPASDFFTPHNPHRGLRPEEHDSLSDTYQGSDSAWADGNANPNPDINNTSYINEVDPLSASMLQNMERRQEMEQSHEEWVSRKVTDQTQQTQSIRTPHYSFDLSENHNSDEENRYRPQQQKQHRQHQQQQQQQRIQKSYNDNNNNNNNNTDATLNHLRELQLSCVQSMSNLRMVKADVLMESEQTAKLTPLQRTVNIQAAKVSE